MEGLGEAGGGSPEKGPGGGVGGNVHLEAGLRGVCFPINEKESMMLFSN